MRTWQTVLLGVNLAMCMTFGVSAAEDIPYEIGKWQESGFGNHRVVLAVSAEDAEKDIVEANIPWRRRDKNPETKAMLLYDEAGTQIKDVLILECSRFRGVIRFRPASGTGKYYLYYLPYTLLGMGASESYYEPEDLSDFAWRENAQNEKNAGKASVLSFQSRDAFNSFYPMEIPATPEETAALKEACKGQKLVVFPEDREHEIKMFEQLPLRWVENGPANQFSAVVQPGEFFVFQLGVWAPEESLENLFARWSGEVEGSCFNVEGIDWKGNAFQKTLSLESGRIRALYFGLQIPQDASGEIQGTIELTADQVPTQTVTVNLKVQGDILPDGGIGDLDRLARLQWLNSTRGQTAGLPPSLAKVAWEDETVKIGNRTVKFDQSGLPGSLCGNDRELLQDAITLQAVVNGEKICLSGDGKAEVRQLDDWTMERRQTGTMGREISTTLQTVIEGDGCVQFDLSMVSEKGSMLDNLELVLPFVSSAVPYWMGMEQRGGLRKGDLAWQWKGKYLNNLIWVGDVSAGVQLKLQSAEDPWALWAQDLDEKMLWQNGSCRSTEQDGVFTITADTGKVVLPPREEVQLRFRLLLTPFKEVSPLHWQVRVSDAKPEARIRHFHHGTAHMPYINYPFTDEENLAANVKDLRSKNVESQLYYTIREISNHCRELWAFRSLDDEIFITLGGISYTDMGALAPAPGEGYPWLREHVYENYVPGWRTDWIKVLGLDMCAALTTDSNSRLANYYVESLHHLFAKTTAQGLYLDGIGYGRKTMQRVARVLSSLREDYRINMHCADLYPFSKLSVMNHCMEHLPYLTDLWLGEFYKYEELSPDFYLIELSGIPFGVANEMLDYDTGGNPYFGMIYGMGGRFLPEVELLWKLWDDCNIATSRMVGYWDADIPVKTSAPGVLSTVYLAEDGKSALIALARWRDPATEGVEQLPVTLEIAPDIFPGYDPDKYELYAPDAGHFQKESRRHPGDEILLPENGGAWLLLRPTEAAGN